jgi:hypothetical protein
MPSCRPKPPVPADRFQGPVDYSARSAFLNATTDLLRPAPIDDLLDLLPVVMQWLRTIPQSENFEIGDSSDFGKRLSITMGLNVGIISPDDDSSEAAEVKRAISDWMKSCRFFGDGWTWILADYAEPTLLAHAFRRCEPRRWYFMEPWRELHPELPSFSQRGDESYMEYIERSDQEYRNRRKENLRSVQFSDRRAHEEDGIAGCALDCSPPLPGGLVRSNRATRAG